MFSATSDPILQAALWAGLIALALTGIMAITIVVLRLFLLRDQARWAQFVQVWRPLLLALMMDDEVAAADGLPPLLPRDRQRFLRLWVYLHESVRGDAADRRLASAHQADENEIAFAERRLGTHTQTGSKVEDRIGHRPVHDCFMTY